MCDCEEPCYQKYPSQTRALKLTPEYLNNAGSKLHIQLPFCVNKCHSNCNLTFDQFHFVALCIKDNCRTCLVGLNDADCNGGELSDKPETDTLFDIRQLPGTRVTLSSVGIELERTDSALWDALADKFGATGEEGFVHGLTLKIEYWVECGDCCQQDIEVAEPLAE